MVQPVHDPALKTWIALNDTLRRCSEARALQLLAAEQCGKRRKQFLLRIHSRLNYIRAVRERRELIKTRRTSILTSSWDLPPNKD